MGNTAPVPPGDGPPPDDEDLDELELTSIMDGEQARELRRVARLAHEAHEGERVTARPLRADDAVDVDVVIPKAPPVPSESLPTPVQAWSASEPPAPAPSMMWLVLAFLLLAAVIAFEVR
jgi:hypothetical protein